MIPDNIDGYTLSGKTCKFLADYRTKYWLLVPSGSFCKIIGASGRRMKSLDVQTLPCPVCGQYTILKRVKRSDLEFAEPPVNNSSPVTGFPIPDSFVPYLIRGRRCRIPEGFVNSAGKGVSPSTVCTIISIHHNLLDLTVDTCPSCQQNIYIFHIPCDKILLLDKYGGQLPTA